VLPVDEHGGFIIRTMANIAEDGELAADVEYLRTLWDAIQARSENTSGPKLIYQELDLAHRVLRDFARQETSRILVDSRETFLRMQASPRNSPATAPARSVITPRSGHCSICTASRTKSRRRWAGAST
jgi:ribonuclease G